MTSALPLAAWVASTVLGGGYPPLAPHPPLVELDHPGASALLDEERDPEREPWAITATVGFLGVFDSDTHRVGGIELRLPGVVHDLQPMLGLAYVEDESWYGYLGVRWNLDLGQRWRLAPGFAVGYFEVGDVLDLGSELEFRSSLELSRSFGHRSRLGLEFYHLSNSSIEEFNPGTEGLVLNLSIALD